MVALEAIREEEKQLTRQPLGLTDFDMFKLQCNSQGEVIHIVFRIIVLFSSLRSEQKKLTVQVER